jgi:hypothetical protein
MSKDDINSLGSLYGGMLNGLKKDLIKEGKVGPKEIGDAALQSGGPTEEGGFTEPEVDIEKLSDKEKKDNLYNVNNLSYTSNYVPAAEEDEEDEDDKKKKGKHDDGDGKDEKCDYVDCEEDAEEDTEDADKEEESEENEESSQISEKIAQDGLNNFMKQKSVFDKLYDKVMVNENFDEMESEDFDALGLDDATPDAEDGDDVTVTLSKDVAKALCDVLQAAMGESDDEDGDEGAAEHDAEHEAAHTAFGEEDEEGIDTGSTHSGKYDDGKNNKVGDLKTAAAASAKCCDNTIDAGSTHSGKYDDGKNNKVGSLSTGQRAVD